MVGVDLHLRLLLRRFSDNMIVLTFVNSFVRKFFHAFSSEIEILMLTIVCCGQLVSALVGCLSV